jgi:hypothetical protein
MVLEIRDGVRWVYRGSGLRTLAVATHAWFVGNAVIGVVLAPYALDSLNLSPFSSASSALSAALAHCSEPRSPPGWVCGSGPDPRSSPVTSSRLLVCW